MSLSSLPWFIRQEIVRLVVKDNTQFRLVDKKWLQQVIIQHGRLVFPEEVPVSRTVSPMISYIETMFIYRAADVDWELIFDCKNIKHIKIDLPYRDHRTYNSFISKLLLLPPLESLSMGFTRESLDLSPFFERNQETLKFLRLPSHLFNQVTSNFTFSNLKRLHLLGTKATLTLQEIVKNMPNLRQVYIFGHIGSNQDLLPGITELYLEFCFGYSLELDLKLVPNLKKLHTSSVGLLDSVPKSNNIEHLRFEAGGECFLKLMASFHKLKSLELDFTGCSPDLVLSLVFQDLVALPKLTSLKLRINHMATLSPIISTGSYPLETLILKDHFKITQTLIDWLSHCTKLKKLILINCVPKRRRLEFVPFEYLKEIDIHCHESYVNQFEKNFDPINYPHVSRISVRKINYDEYYRSTLV